MKIAIITRHDPTNMSNWSGTPYYITQEIKKISDDVVLINVEKKAWIIKAAKFIERIVRLSGAYNIDLSFTNAYSKHVAKEIQKKIDFQKPQMIVGIAASPELANINFDAPVIHISDATYAILTDYYSRQTGIPKWLKREGNEIERKILDKSFFTVLSSQWALDSALKDYDTKPNKIHLLKLGANVGELPQLSDEYLENKFNGKCNILFIGKEWKRKGGSILLSAFKILRQSGMDVSLTIVGCNPFLKKPPAGITVYPFIKKSEPKQFALYNQLFIDASFFVLPTRAEAYGLVFAEAAAFSTPVIAPRTGGIPSVVEDGKSGVLLPLSAGGEEYAEAITKLWGDKDLLHKFGRYAQKKYTAELNWDKWRCEFEVLVDNIRKES